MAENLHNEDWENEAPKLASLKGKWQPQAPEGYFETLPQTVMQRLQAEGNLHDQPHGGSRRWGWARWAGTAAAVALVTIGLWWSFGPESQPLNSHDMLAEAHTLSTEELIHAVDFVGIETAEIMSVMGDEALSAINLTQEADAADLNEYLNGNPLPSLDWEELDLPDSAILEHLNI